VTTGRALLVIALLAACAASLGARAHTPAPPSSFSPEHVAAIKRQAASVRPGTRLKLYLADGRRLKGVIIGTTDHDLHFMVTKGAPRETLELAYGDVEAIVVEHRADSAGIVKMVMIGVGTLAAIVIPIALCG
jgi:hypothetical protein